MDPPCMITDSSASHSTRCIREKKLRRPGSDSVPLIPLDQEVAPEVAREARKVVDIGVNGRVVTLP